MSDEKRESKVLRVLIELTTSAANGARLNGERSAFFQIFDAEPDQPTEPEIQEMRLDVEAARRFIGERLNSGFLGIAGFTCIRQEEGDWVLRSEVFETGTNVSASAYLPLKRNLFGKFKATKDNIQLDGFPSIPGAFTSKADAEKMDAESNPTGSGQSSPTAAKPADGEAGPTTAPDGQETR